MKFIFLSIFTLAMTSCLKTTEEIRKEENLSKQLEQAQKFDKDFLIQVQDLQQKVDAYQGRFEEVEHKQFQHDLQNKEKMEQFMQQMNEQMSALKVISENNQKAISALQESMKQQSQFIQKVTKSLSGIKTTTPAPSSGNPLKQLDEAHSLFEKKKYAQAAELYENLLGSNKLGAAKANSALLNLGIIRYNQKKYSDALTHLSKIYTRWPRSSKAPSALYHIGLCFKAMKQNDEAKESFDQVVKKYSKNAIAKKAKEQLETL